MARQASDAALLERIARADDGALAELYDRYGGSAYALALRILGDPARAAAAVESAFSVTWRSPGSSLGRQAGTQSWILSLVHRRTIELLRREWPSPADRIARLAKARADARGEAAAAGHPATEQALRRLPREQREVLELAYYAGLTESELAEWLDQPATRPPFPA